MVTHILYQATVPQNSLYSIKTHVSLSHFLSTVMRSMGTMGFSIYIISPSNYFFTSFSISRGNVCFSFNLSLLHRVAFTAMILLNIISLLPFFLVSRFLKLVFSIQFQTCVRFAFLLFSFYLTFNKYSSAFSKQIRCYYILLVSYYINTS